jgi:hypothetical protein
MRRKMKPAPPWLRHRALVCLFQSRLAVVLMNWLAQGVRMMLPVERCLKLLLGTVYAAGVLVLLSAAGLRGTALLALALVLAHTLNWLTNGHFHVLMRYCYPRETDPQRLLDAASAIASRLAMWPAVLGVVAFGSLSRDAVSGGSDLDLRVVTDDRLDHQWIGALLVWRERAIAFIQGFPLDVYLATTSRGWEKLRADEAPVILLDATGAIAKLRGKA